MVLTYLHFRILEFPLKYDAVKMHQSLFRQGEAIGGILCQRGAKDQTSPSKKMGKWALDQFILVDWVWNMGPQL